MSRSLAGPWITPENDTFDSRAYYAAKTFSDGKKRYIFGWNPTKGDSKDEGGWQWGGNLVLHEVIQEPDGSLSVKIPDTVDRVFKKRLDYCFENKIGNWKAECNRMIVNAVDSYACAIAGDMPNLCKIESNIAFEKNTRSCGLILRAGDDMDSGYYIRLEPGRNRMVFDLWPRYGDFPFVAGLERPIELIPGQKYNIKVIIDETIGVVYLDNKVAMNIRLYNFPKGRWGIFVSEGNATFDNIGIWTI